MIAQNWISQCLLLFLLMIHDGTWAQQRIVGGHDANVLTHPFFAGLYETSVGTLGYRCGGSLVAPDVILSAAHCIESSGSIRYAVINSTSISGDNPYSYQREVIQIIVHPGWDSSKLRNDLALLFLDAAVNEVNPVSYSHYFPILSPIDTLSIVGLGRTMDGGPFPDVLQEANVELNSFEECDAAFSGTGLLNGMFQNALNESTQFCASAPGKDACQGDSGGPLLVSSSTVQDEQIGIISFGIGCALPDYFGVYTKVPAYATWLDETICSSSRFLPSFCLYPSESTTAAPTEVGRNVDMSTSGLIASTQSSRGLLIIDPNDFNSVKLWPLPEEVSAFHDVSIDDENGFIFAVDMSERVLCCYRFHDHNLPVFQWCDSFDSQSLSKRSEWSDENSGGISCRFGVCVVAEGDEGVTVFHYDTKSGSVRTFSSDRMQDVSESLRVFSDVTIINASWAVMSTSFADRTEIEDDTSHLPQRFGTVLLNVQTAFSKTSFTTVGTVVDLCQTNENDYSNLKSTIHTSKSGNRFVLTACGAMAVQSLNPASSDSTLVVVDDIYFGGLFRATSVAVDDKNEIAVFGGVVAEDKRNYVMVFGLARNPMIPTPLGIFQIPDSAFSIAIRDKTVATVGTNDGVHILTLPAQLQPVISGPGGASYSNEMAASQSNASLVFISSSGSKHEYGYGTGMTFRNAVSSSPVPSFASRFTLTLTVWLTCNLR